VFLLLLEVLFVCELARAAALNARVPAVSGDVHGGKRVDERGIESV
jgi:hypothetical protein